jgi:hypothetical protein
MRVRTIAVRTSVVMITAAALLAGTTGAQAAAPNSHGNDASPYWTPARRHAAIPRDVVIDGRGLAYLRHADGTLTPYGHDTPRADQLKASATPQAKPSGGGGGGGGGGTGDTTGPTISNLNPAPGATIGGSYTFSADVSDVSGVRSVSFVIVYPGNTKTQSFSASAAGGTKWSVALNGFTDGSWGWYVKAADGAGRTGNTSTSATASFTVSTGTPAPSGDTVTNAEWAGGGTVETAAGRLYFEMPANSKQTRWQGYVCSGTTVTDNASGRSIVLTAAHCVYDDANKAFARNVLFIPDQSWSGSATDLDCANDRFGCWSPSFGVVDVHYTQHVFPDNDAWDYAYYVANDTGAHSGNGAAGALDQIAGSMGVSFNAPSTGQLADALGYSYSDDPNFMYCQDSLGTTGAVNWWLPSCGLSGGASGGPWLQPAGSGNGSIFSVNSWGYTTAPGMAGPKLNGTSASCVFDAAKAAALNGGNLATSC